jgi:GlpG protein
MRAVGQLPNEEAAKRFSDYLWSKSIENEIEPDEGTAWLIWAVEEDSLSECVADLKRFLANPESAEFDSLDRKAREAKQKLEEERKPKRRQMSGKDVFVSVRAYRPGPLTYAFMCGCILVSVFTNFADNEARSNLFHITSLMHVGDYVQWTRRLPEVWSGQIWRLVTPMFLHMGLIHLLFNCWILFSFGSQMEARCGWFFMLLFVLLAAAFSNFLQYFFVSPSFGGFSGVNYALFGYIWMKSRYDRSAGLGVSKENVVLLVAWFGLGALQIIPHMANWCHGGGLFFGVVWGYFTSPGALDRLIGGKR